MRKNSLFLLGAATGVGLTLLVTGPQGGSQLVAAAKAATGPDTYSQLNLFGEVFERIRTNYVEKPDDAKLIEASINGMIAALDPHSRYMNEKAWRDMRETTSGEFGGLGIEVMMEDGLVKVVAPMDDTPAAKAGIMSGDLITHINDEAVEGLTLEQAVSKMKGPISTKTRLKIIRKGAAAPIDDHARNHPHAPGQLPHRRWRRRLCQDHHVQRTDNRRIEKSDRRHIETDPAGKVGWLRGRLAQ
jgi:carboxyl-terminal processing protease